MDVISLDSHKKLYSSVQTLSSAEEESEAQNNFSIFNGDSNDKDILAFCVIVKDVLNKEEKIEDEEEFVKKNEEGVIRKKFENKIYEKYIKIFDHVFNAEEKFSEVQFKKFISMIVYVSLNPNVYYNKDTIKNKTNSVYIYNESLYKSIQIAIASFLLNLRVITYLKTKMNFTIDESLKEKTHLLIDKVHLTELKKEILALISDTPLPIEVISNNSNFSTLIDALPTILSRLDNINNIKQFYHINEFLSPFSSEMINLSNSIFSLNDLLNSYMKIINVFRIEREYKILFLSYKDTVNEKEIIAHCYKDKKYIDSTACLLFLECSIENKQNRLSSIFDIKCNRGAIVKHNSDYVYTIGITEQSELIGIDLHSQNGNSVDDFISKFKFDDYDWDKNFSVNPSNIYRITPSEITDTAILLFMFTSDDEFTNMIYTMKEYANTDESLFTVIDYASAPQFYSGVEINLLPSEEDGEFSIIDLNK